MMQTPKVEAGVAILEATLKVVLVEGPMNERAMGSLSGVSSQVRLVKGEAIIGAEVPIVMVEEDLGVATEAHILIT